MSDEEFLYHKEAAILYHFLKKPSKTLSTVHELVDHYPVVTQEDIDNGYLVRYFVRQANHQTGTITEIDVRTFRRLSSNPLYKAISLNWKITGKIDDIVGPNSLNSPVRLSTGVETANKMTVENADMELPGLKYKLMNYIEFWMNIGEA